MRVHLPDGALKRRPVDDVDVSDLTDSKRTEASRWLPGDVLDMPFDVDPTPAEQDAIVRRLTTAPGVEGTLQQRVRGAYAEMQAFENQANVSNADVVRIVRLLCKVVRGLIRLQLRQLDQTD